MIEYHGKAEGPLLPLAYGNRVLSLFFECGDLCFPHFFVFQNCAKNFGGV